MVRNQEREPVTVKWIEWLGATAVAAALLVAYAFTNFSTKAEAEQYDRNVTGRLDRIEHKIDAVLERKR